MNLLNKNFHITTTSLIVFLSLNILTFNLFSKPPGNCEENCFSSEIISIIPEDNCYLYEVEVTYTGTCDFELSHYTIDLGCGSVSEASNSDGWKMELNGVDPTTGLSGLKVDNVSGFGKNDTFKSFTVQFKFCPDEECTENPECMVASTAYKAGQCVYYGEVEGSCVTPLHVNAVPHIPSCNGGGDGTIELNITGGKPPYSIMWSDGTTDSLLINAAAGIYSFTVTDAKGNAYTGEVPLNEPEPLAISATKTSPSCEGVHTGAITLQISGGAAPYSFQWSNGSTEKDINGLDAGSYTATVTDEKGCTASDTYILENTNQMIVSQTITQPTCGENEFGSIELEVQGGNAPYQFLWSDGAEVPHRYDLTDGFYEVLITDQSGCEVSKSYSIKTLTSLSASANITHTNCFNVPEGIVDLFVTGGTKPYVFEWSNGSSDEDIFNLTAGKYSVLITDAKGCMISFAANVNQQNLLVYAWANAQPSCVGSEDAAIDGMAFFGQEPYTYEWSNGETGEDLNNVRAGVYTLYVTDAIGCTGSATVNIAEPRAIEVNYTVVPQGCTENITYDISLSVFGGAGGYSYEWSNGAATKNIFGQEEGTYSITVTDTNGCSHTEEIVADGDPGLIDCDENDNPDDSEDPDNPDSGDDGDDPDNGDSGDDAENGGDNEGDDETEDSGDDIDDGDTNDGNEDTDEDGGTDDEEEDPVDDDGNPEEDEDVPGNGPENACDECFFTSPVVVVNDGTHIRYSVTVNHDNDCRFDLSHLVISIPECAEVVDYSNSMGWPMELVNPDPKTGVSGIKVDNIPSFGKDDNLVSFEVNITLEAPGEACMQSLQCYMPEVAYKAATCIYYEQTAGECVAQEQAMYYDVQVYPNPVLDNVTVKVNTDVQGQDYYIDIINFQGKVIYSQQHGGNFQELSFDLSKFKGDVFFIKIVGSRGSQQITRVLKN